MNNYGNEITELWTYVIHILWHIMQMLGVLCKIYVNISQSLPHNFHFLKKYVFVFEQTLFFIVFYTNIMNRVIYY